MIAELQLSSELEATLAPSVESEVRYPLEPRKGSMRLQQYEAGPDKQRVGTGVYDAREVGADGKPSGRTFIFPMSYAAMLEPFEAQRFTQWAEANKARVIAVENPGVGVDSSPLTWRQRFNYMRGKFDAAGVAVTDAVFQAGGLQKDEAVTVVGYSMGASVALELLAGLDARGVLVEECQLHEPTANQRHRLGMIGLINAEVPHHDKYFQPNERYNDRYEEPRAMFVQPSDRREHPEGGIYALGFGDNETELANYERNNPKWRDSWAVKLGGIALIRGRWNKRAEEVIENGANLDRTRFVFVNFDGSGMSSAERNIRSANIVRAAQERVWLHRELQRCMGNVARMGAECPVPERVVLSIRSKNGLNHPAWHSMAFIDWLSRALVRFFDESRAADPEVPSEQTQSPAPEPARAGWRTGPVGWVEKRRLALEAASQKESGPWAGVPVAKHRWGGIAGQ